MHGATIKISKYIYLPLLVSAPNLHLQGDISTLENEINISNSSINFKNKSRQLYILKCRHCAQIDS
jgi:hypothetical protein